MTVRMTMFFIWVLTPCRLVGRYQHFGGTYCLHLQGDSMFLHGVKTQMNNIVKSIPNSGIACYHNFALRPFYFPAKE
jgi:hypothetical protein